ncbi:peptide ABC transporter permease [Mycolicibacterium chitae]|uniref:Binding-protein-dependent transport systems inner membrane component n=1 Tax=Mycolicibacterium chitae TaxID=1792 RepID=A0A448ID16_MYCCI|nr:ABC transporter permease [Mycolicibacterium chitae]MCV7109139.1 ABC transporter permease [Mycolicibacterium chitae]BBZ01503.1 peptide ABC transporter permease [Mycolicibacterium chitae]VEG50339.1 binding-protein-dependent transport systems inner membrane component [Mycolicibacterium chitae]
MKSGRLLARIGQYALVLWAAATLNFALPHLSQGDPIVYLYGENGDLAPELLEELRANYGLDRPILEQYGAFWADLVRGDLGTSVEFNRPVVDILLDYLPWTVALAAVSILLAFLIGNLLGAWAAWRRGTRRDAGAVVAVLLVDAMPAFWIGMILVAVFAVQLGVFPSYGAAAIDGRGIGWFADVAARMVLPVATMVVATLGGFFLLARAAMVTVLDEPFVRLARAKGLSERRIVLRHAWRNALLPVYTNVTLAVGALLSGSVVVETVFAYPGIGRLMFNAVTARDYPLLQGGFLVITVGIVAANVLADLTYPILDPRVRPEQRASGVAVP